MQGNRIDDPAKSRNQVQLQFGCIGKQCDDARRVVQYSLLGSRNVELRAMLTYESKYFTKYEEPSFTQQPGTDFILLYRRVVPLRVEQLCQNVCHPFVSFKCVNSKNYFKMSEVGLFGETRTLACGQPTCWVQI